MKYLFLFTISPVQVFITQARKAQDLYAGSLILTDIMKCALQYILNNKQSIIYPVVDLDDHKSSCSHRILALVETANMQQFGDAMQDHIHEQFIENIITGLIDNIGRGAEQIKDYFRFYWVAKKYTPENHAREYKELEKLLTGVKSCRYFAPFAETGRKCTLNGELNVKVYRKTKQELSKSKEQIIRSKLFNTDVDILDYNEFTKNKKIQHIAAGEGLSALSYLKRIYKPDDLDSFPSTARVALMKILCDEHGDDLPYWVEYKKLFHKKDDPKQLFNEQLIFPDNLNKEYFERQNLNFILNNTDLQTIKEARNRIFHEKQLTKYYAVLQFDGDNMGKWLTGEYNSAGLVFQQYISQQLSQFARAARDYLQAPKGKCIYAGGDDFLGFVNIHNVFKVIEDLRIMFNTIVNIPVYNQFKDSYTKVNINISFSAGISIAHYKTPLSTALKWAAKMQENAKQSDPDSQLKNAFGIAVLKGAGSIEQTVMSFGDNEGNNARLLSIIIKYLQSKDFSFGFISALHKTFGSIISPAETSGIDADILRTELNRLLRRAANKNWDKNKKTSECNTMTSHIMSLYKPQNPYELLSILNICDFITRKTN